MATKRSSARVTLHDVAREAGVSVASASRALNGSDRVVRPDVLARVVAAAERLQYVANVSAQAMRKGSSSTIGLIVNHIADPYFSGIAEGLIRAAKAKKITVTIAASDGDPALEAATVAQMRTQGHRAIVIAGTRVAGDSGAELGAQLAPFERASGSVVLISQPGLPYPTVALDNAGGARRLAVQLAGHGYRRFAVLSGGSSLRTVEDRLRGFEEGLAQMGLGIDDADVVVGELTRDGGYATASELLRRRRGEFDLIFALNDLMAVGAMAALRDHGIGVGADVGVAGFDDVGMARDVTPALTTVSAPLSEMGAFALELALSPAEAGSVRLFPATPVLRDSTPRRIR